MNTEKIISLMYCDANAIPHSLSLMKFRKISAFVCKALQSEKKPHENYKSEKSHTIATNYRNVLILVDKNKSERLLYALFCWTLCESPFDT